MTATIYYYRWGLRCERTIFWKNMCIYRQRCVFTLGLPSLSLNPVPCALGEVNSTMKVCMKRSMEELQNSDSPCLRFAQLDRAVPAGTVQSALRPAFILSLQYITPVVFTDPGAYYVHVFFAPFQCKMNQKHLFLRGIKVRSGGGCTP